VHARRLGGIIGSDGGLADVRVDMVDRVLYGRCTISGFSRSPPVVILTI